MSGKPGSPPPVRAYSSSGRASSKSRHTVYADPDTLPRASSIRRENTGKRSIGSRTSSTQNQPSFAEPTSATKRLKKVPVNYAELIPGYESMTAAEKVRAKMRFNLQQVATSDISLMNDSQDSSSSSDVEHVNVAKDRGWERFTFDRTARYKEAREHSSESDRPAHDYRNRAGYLYRPEATATITDMNHENAIFAPTMQDTLSREKSPSNKMTNDGNRAMEAHFGDTTGVANEEAVMNVSFMASSSSSSKKSWRDS